MYYTHVNPRSYPRSIIKFQTNLVNWSPKASFNSFKYMRSQYTIHDHIRTMSRKNCWLRCQHRFSVWTSRHSVWMSPKAQSSWDFKRFRFLEADHKMSHDLSRDDWPTWASVTDPWKKMWPIMKITAISIGLGGYVERAFHIKSLHKSPLTIESIQSIRTPFQYNPLNSRILVRPTKLYWRYLPDLRHFSLDPSCTYPRYIPNFGVIM